MYREYRDRAAFYIVYIQEAHPVDLWQVSANVKDEVLFANPKSDSERTTVAASCVRDLGIELPALVDNLQDTTEADYSGWPDRLYLIDVEGRVAYKSKPGPFGFKPDELRAALNRVMN